MAVKAILQAREVEKFDFRLTRAAFFGTEDETLAALREDGWVEETDWQGWTALHAAADRGFERAVSEMLSLGAPALRSSRDGSLAQHVAASSYECGVSTLTALAKASGEVDMRDEDGWSALHCACAAGNAEKAAALIRMGANKSMRAFGDLRTPLMSAISSGSTDTVRVMLESGSCLTDMDDRKRGMAHFAASAGSAEIMRMIAEAGVDLHGKAESGRTPSHEAASSGQAESLKELHRLGALSRDADEFGISLMHLAARSGSAPCVEFLAEVGFSQSERDSSGRSPLHWAASSCGSESARWREVVGLLSSLGAKVDEFDDNDSNTPMHEACRSVEMIEALSKLGAKPDMTNALGQTAMHLTAERGRVESILKLAELGWNPNALDYEGMTPLFYAVGRGSLDCMEALASVGADFSITDENGQTAIATAVAMDRIDLADFLIRRGAIAKPTDYVGADNETSRLVEAICESRRLKENLEKKAYSPRKGKI